MVRGWGNGKGASGLGNSCSTKRALADKGARAEGQGGKEAVEQKGGEQKILLKPVLSDEQSSPAEEGRSFVGALAAKGG